MTAFEKSKAALDSRSEDLRNGRQELWGSWEEKKQECERSERLFPRGNKAVPLPSFPNSDWQLSAVLENKMRDGSLLPVISSPMGPISSAVTNNISGTAAKVEMRTKLRS